MTSNFKKPLAVTALALISSLSAVNSLAMPVDLIGSSSIGSSGATIQAGLNLASPGLLITVVNPKYGLGNGDYEGIPTDSIFTLAGPLSLGNMASWNITGSILGTLGTYVVAQLTIITQTADFLNVYTKGIFTPGTQEGHQFGGCATGTNTCAPSDTSLRWTFSKTGNSVSAGGTLASPSAPLGIPEPTSLSLLAIGLIGWFSGHRTSSKDKSAY